MLFGISVVKVARAVNFIKISLHVKTKGVFIMKITQLCALKKNDIEKHTKKIIKIVKNPKFVCTKCIRVAHEKDFLCHPQKIK